MIADFQFGTWIPSLQIGNGIIQGQYMDRIGNWTRVGHQVFINGFFRLNYNETQAEEARLRNTTVPEIRIGILPYESSSGASVFNLVISNNQFILNNQQRFFQPRGSNIETEVLSVGARSIWGSPRMRVFATERAISEYANGVSRMPLAIDLSIQDLRPSTYGIFTEIRVSGTYTAFPDLSTTDPVNTPPPTITQSKALREGSLVRINQTAQTWATGQSIPKWVLGQTYIVSQLRNYNTELLLEGVNSWIRVKDVTLI